MSARIILDKRVTSQFNIQCYQPIDTLPTKLMARYSSLLISDSPSSEVVLKYRALRLLALQTNPEAFSSEYETQAALPLEEWRSRVDSNGGTKMTIVLVDKEDHAWVGMITIQTPDFLRAMPFPLPSAAKSAKAAPYILVAMWVHPRHRRRGLGAQLLKAAKGWIGGHGGGEQAQSAKKVVLLGVRPSNMGAITLYRSAGYVEIKDNEVQDEEEIWMALEV
jgi:ribosomal protein S18 acetylase RimI-like enzyme